MTFSLALLTSADPLGRWMDQHGGELSIQNMLGTWHVTVSWCLLRSKSDAKGMHRETWSVSRYDRDFSTAVRSAVEEAMSQTEATRG